MHWQAFSFIQSVKSFLPQYFHQTTVIELGSVCVNYSISELFDMPINYLGVDLTSGKGVDIICDAKIVNLGGNFDVAISCECFEHNPHYNETFANMTRHVRAGGLVLFTCATTGRAEHGTARTTPEQSPGTTAVGWDYYQNVVEQDFSPEYLESTFSTYRFFTNSISQDLYFIGIKNGAEITVPFDLLADTIEIHERLGRQFNRLWQAETGLDFISEIVNDLLLIERVSINPYICENTMPLLIQRSDGNPLLLNKIKKITSQLLLQFPASNTALYLMALVEYKLSEYTTSLSYALRVSQENMTPQLTFLLINNFYDLGLYSEALKRVVKNEMILMNSVRWMKINIANKLWQLHLKGQKSGAILQDLCVSEEGCIELNTILCRYNTANGFAKSAIKQLKEQLDGSIAPDWVIREFLQLTEKEYGLNVAREYFILFNSQVNNIDNFSKYSA